MYRLKGQEYFPIEVREKCKKIFALFSKKNKGHSSFDEIKEILTCCNSKYDDEELLEKFCKLLDHDGKGVQEDDLYLLMTKKKKDQDPTGHIHQAFESLGLRRDGSGRISADDFFEYLTEKGYKYTEEQAAIVLKEADPKNTGFVDVSKFIELISGTASEKKKSKKK